MTTDTLRDQRERARERDAGPVQGLWTEGRQVTVPVIPLWERRERRELPYEEARG